MITSEPWTPVLEGEEAEQAFAIVRQIAGELTAERFGDDASGLAFGPGGLALFLAYVARATGEPEERERAVQVLLHALRPRAGAANPGDNPSIFSGFPGLTWLTEHLRDEVGGRADALLEQTDEAVAEALEQEEWRGPFSYAEGVIGLGTYLLERGASPRVHRALGRVVHHLERGAVKDGTGVTWLRPASSFPAHVRPRGDIFDLGIPRGTMGAVAFLSHALARGIEPVRTGSLLRRALDWLLGQQCLDDPRGRFGDWVAPGDPPPRPTRLAWCYGDLGAALVLHAAAEATHDEALRQAATDLALLTTKRGSADAQIEDAGFCHGATGAGNLYARLYAKTGEEQLLEASRRWFRFALALHQPGKGTCGFTVYYPTDDDPTFHHHGEPGLLMGTAGVGLSLLSACRPVAPEWGRYFLLG